MGEKKKNTDMIGDRPVKLVSLWQFCNRTILSIAGALPLAFAKLNTSILHSAVYVTNILDNSQHSIKYRKIMPKT